MKRHLTYTLGLLILSLLLAACGQVVGDTTLEPQALILTVTQEGDSGPGTLRRAIELADPESTITFADNVRTITLSSQLRLDKNLTIRGPGGGGVTISGGGVTRVFSVATGTVVELHTLTITGGNGVEGGGILNQGTLTVTNSTFSGNRATAGGGISNSGGTLTVTNSTFSGNRATSGGGVSNFNAGNLSVMNSTFAGNNATTGGGIFNNGSLTLTNSIVALNTGTSDTNIRGPITSGSANLIGGDPGLELEDGKPKLADNGGPTKTVALLEGSPAIDAIPEGTNGCGTTITQDQRGVARPQGAACDIGAFEAEPRPVLDTTPPVITPTVTGTLGDNGWYVSDVTVSWEVTDGESEISSQTGCDETVVSADTGGLTLTCSAESAGGAASESVTVKRDATSPSISVTGVEQGRSYVLGAVPEAACQTSDATSGVAAFASLSVTGGNPDGTGHFTASCLGARDHAGNPGSASVDYTVTAPAGSTPSAPIEQLDALTAHVKSLKLHRTTERTLLTQLGAARRALVRGRDAVAVRSLNGFVKTVDALRGRPRVGIRPADANVLKREARGVIAAIRAR